MNENAPHIPQQEDSIENPFANTPTQELKDTLEAFWKRQIDIESKLNHEQLTETERSQLETDLAATTENLVYMQRALTERPPLNPFQKIK